MRSGTHILVLVAIGIVLSAGLPARGREKMLSASKVSIVVVFDNYPHRKDLKTSWGFACVVLGAEKTVLFDTGGDGAVLMDNLRRLEIDPKSIDAVVLSHAHGDHTGGLGAFLTANPNVQVFMPESFPRSFKTEVEATGAKVVEVSGAREICSGVWSTGEAGEGIVEESLAVRTDRGLILITGCAHPGILLILEKAKQLFPGTDLLLAMGGFHLRSESDTGLNKIIGRFRKLGVRRAGPSHCSGDRTRELFKQEYRQDFVQIGAGSVVHFEPIE
jgi:7,8-dihydropterin-6-yl-methyl-4-(beta-D-ribofuranosyl)aminobenzene 5'-phosphate synthase